MPELSYMKLPFDEAIKYFMQKINLPTERWTDLWQGMHARAFVVAGATKDELLADLRKAVDKAIAQGTSIGEFRKDFDKIVEKHGWSYKGKRGWRTAVIYSTNLSTAYSAGRYEQMIDPDVKKAFPYWRYVTMDDSRVRPEHRAWHGITLPANDPWWNEHYPPNGWGCRCRVEVVSRREYANIPDSQKIAPPTKTYKWKNPHTGEILQVPVGIDPGWDYNVGVAAWGNRLVQKAMEEAATGRWVDVDPWSFEKYSRPKQIPADLPKAKIGKRADTEAELRAALINAIGGEEAVFKNPIGETVVINQGIIDHILAQKTRWDGREAYFPFIPELITDPYEIWINFIKNEVTGQYAIRERYCKLLLLDKKTVVGLAAERLNSVWSGFTFFRGKESALNNLRKGRLLWGRK